METIRPGPPPGSTNAQHGATRKTNKFASLRVTEEDYSILENNYKKYKKVNAHKRQPSRSSFLIELGLNYK